MQFDDIYAIFIVLSDSSNEGIRGGTRGGFGEREFVWLYLNLAWWFR